MVQSGRRARFALQAFQLRPIGDERLGQQFQPDLALEPFVAGQVNDTHPAGTED